MTLKPFAYDPRESICALSAEVAKKIAAGEVIDRPASVLRELIDNSLDSGASSIQAEVNGGGVDLIRVADNGAGMTKEDLELCWLPHTTSKIRSDDDLLRLASLGFRGEALSSISAVSELEIASTRNGRDAWKLQMRLDPAVSENGSSPVDCSIAPIELAAGTIVEVKRLFENFPARRRFLKRPAAENALCRQIFIDKALAWPKIAFKYTCDGAVKCSLPAEQTYKNRCLYALAPKEPEEFFYEIDGAGEGFSFTVTLGSPEVSRRDKRNIYVFVNGRRVLEYSLIHAIEYGAEGAFPNGTHPFACLFFRIDPALADFNIHPAKKEVKFQNPDTIHRDVSSAIRNFYHRYLSASSLRRYASAAASESAQPDLIEDPAPSYGSRRGALPDSRGFTDYSGGVRRGGGNAENGVACGSGAEYLLSKRREFIGAAVALREGSGIKSTVFSVSETSGGSPPNQNKINYLGQVFKVFLAAEYNGKFYLIDQHAAHERILYNRYCKTGGRRQELLVPYVVDTASPAEDEFLRDTTDELTAAGFTLERASDGRWSVTAVPLFWSGSADDIRADIFSIRGGAKSAPHCPYESAACRQAVKEGDVLDSDTAKNIVEQTFLLDEPFCPHGRPVWIEWTKEALYALVKRT